MLSSLKLFLNNATFVFALPPNGGRFCSLLGRKLETAAVLSNIVHHFLQCQSSLSFSGPKLLMRSLQKCCTGLSCPASRSPPREAAALTAPLRGEAGRFLPAPFCLGSPGPGVQFCSAAHVVLVLIQWVCSRNGLV